MPPLQCFLQRSQNSPANTNLPDFKKLLLKHNLSPKTPKCSLRVAFRRKQKSDTRAERISLGFGSWDYMRGAATFRRTPKSLVRKGRCLISSWVIRWDFSKVSRKSSLISLMAGTLYSSAAHS